MKVCPVCRTTYDDSQNFCLNDGTPLVNYAASEPRRVEPLTDENSEDDGATVVRSTAATNPGARGSTNYGQTIPSAEPPLVVPKKSNTAKIVLLTAMLTILLVALAGAGIFLATRGSGNTQIAQINDNKNAAKPKNNNANLNANSNLNQNINANINANANLNANLINANININANLAPSPSPVLTTEQATKIRRDVDKTLDQWRAATDDRNLDSHMSFYGENVDYYRAGNVNIGKVRADRQKAFDTYNNIEVELSNIKITPDASGSKATVTFDKSWNFENDEATSEGKVQQQLQMENLGGRWYITREKDLNVYYSRKY